VFQTLWGMSIVPDDLSWRQNCCRGHTAPGQLPLLARPLKPIRLARWVPLGDEACSHQVPHAALKPNGLHQQRRFGSHGECSDCKFGVCVCRRSISSSLRQILVARVASRLSTILPDIFGTMGDTGDTAAGCWLRAWEVTRPGRPPFYT
jgi:hypothetical protein